MLLSSATHTDSLVWWVKAVPRNTCFAYSLSKATAVFQEEDMHQQQALTVAQNIATSHSVPKIKLICKNEKIR